MVARDFSQWGFFVRSFVVARRKLNIARFLSKAVDNCNLPPDEHALIKNSLRDLTQQRAPLPKSANDPARPKQWEVTYAWTKTRLGAWGSHLSNSGTSPEIHDYYRQGVPKIVEAPPPAGWYCRYGPSLNTRSLVVEHGGFLYDSDAYNDELPYWTQVSGKSHLVVPYGLAMNDAKFIRGGMATANDFFEYLRDSFDMLYREGGRMMSVGLHLRLSGHPGRAAGVERFLDHIMQFEDVWVCRRDAIARHWHEHHVHK